MVYQGVSQCNFFANIFMNLKIDINILTQ